jgi:hypothetical protein
LKFNSITIIGTGTLGGHLCKHLAESSEINKLTLVDQDLVDTKDTEFGIFKPVDIHEPKVHVLYRMFSNYKIEIEPIVKFYKDGITILPPSDLTIDCRNVFGKRDLNIDIKMFIADRVLVLDFQKNCKDENQLKGEYHFKLSSHEISTAAYYATNLITCDNILEELLRSRSVKYIDIDIIKSTMLQSINDSKQKCDLIYDLDEDTRRLKRVNEIIQPIIKKNKERPLKLAVKERDSIVRNVFEFPKVAETTYQIIPQNTLKNSKDVIDVLRIAVKDMEDVSKIIPVLIHDEIYILRETGGA